MLNYFHKIRDYGLINSSTIVARRIRATYIFYRWARKVSARTAQHTWQQISNHDFTFYWATKNNFNYPEYILGNFVHPTIKSQELYNKSYWHDSFVAEHTKFYKNIVIPIGESGILSPDIKVPWERSRFQQIATFDAENFFVSITSWLEHNHFMQGVNWVCPMEVAIRAINWIWGYHFFRTSTSAPTFFWQKFTCSLYDHMIYLDHNWERYDGRTNNHYLSDLVGYLYLCWFFKDLPDMQQKTAWCYRELLQELDKQVFPEGTCYEGSTAYHKLVTELYAHALFIMQELGFDVPTHYYARYRAMRQFVNLCTPAPGEFIIIGDDDSGSVLHAELYPKSLVNSHDSESFYLPEFGLSVIKTKRLHITLRHHAYKKNQPSGHFHNDAASITLFLDGIAIFVDPGSYVYTPSRAWRNYFRSVQVHNTFFIAGHEPVPFDERLFALNIPSLDTFYFAPTELRRTLPTSPRLRRAGGTNGLATTQHNLYKRFGLTAQRTVQYTDNEITLSDVWLSDSECPDKTSCWNFTLAPSLRAEQNGAGINLVYNKKTIVTLYSDTLTFEIIPGWYAPEYGAKVPTQQLRAYGNVVCNKKFIIKLTY